MARREKKPVHKVVMTEGKRNIIQQLLQEYDIETAEDIQNALKDLLGGTIKEMMEAEMDDHLGYQKSERSDSDDYRNGYKSKRVNSSYGSIHADVSSSRNSLYGTYIWYLYAVGSSSDVFSTQTGNRIFRSTGYGRCESASWKPIWSAVSSGRRFRGSWSRDSICYFQA